MMQTTIIKILDVTQAAIFLILGLGILYTILDTHETVEEINRRLTVTQTLSSVPDEGVVGQYRPQSNLFWVDTSENAATTTHTMYHEYAHYLYEEFLTEKERNVWKQLSNNSSWYPTKYSRTSIKEDFADTYAYVQTNCAYMQQADSGLIIRYQCPVNNDKTVFIKKILQEQYRYVRTNAIIRVLLQ